MTPPLCDAVLGTDDAADSLEALARSNAFVVPLDDHGGWYRYHHLFGDLLRAELKRRHPELLPVYLGRAAAWCELHGSPDEAFAYAHERGDLAQAGRIALGHWDELAGRGQIETLRLWLDRCTDEEIESDAQLSIAAAWVSVFLGEAAGRGGSSPRPSGGRSTWHPPTGRRRFARHSRSSELSGSRRRPRDAARRRVRLTAEKQEGTRWLLGACRALGTAYVLLGRPQEAIAVLREALALSSQRPELATRGSSVSAIWPSRPRRSAIGETRSDGRSKRQLVEEARLDEMAQSAIAYTAGALAHQQRGDHTEAARQLENVRRLRPLLRAGPWLEADFALRCADISLDLGDLAGALELAQVASDALQGYPDAGTLPARLRGSRRGSGGARTTSSRRPSSGSSASCGRISRSRRSPIVFTSRALPSRHKSPRSTTSSASRAGPKPSRSSSSPASDRSTAGPRFRILTPTELETPYRRPSWCGCAISQLWPMTRRSSPS